MTRSLSLLLVVAFAASITFAACGKDANTQMCLDEYAQFKDLAAKKDNKAKEMAGALYQTCGISCDITKDEEACAALVGVTETICKEAGKKACQALCDGDKKKNDTACALVAKM